MTVWLTIWHCLACQKRSGSPFGEAAYWLHDDVLIEGGGGKQFHRPTDLGSVFSQFFCAQCGTTVFMRGTKNLTMTGIPIGLFDDPHTMQPIGSVWETLFDGEASYFLGAKGGFGFVNSTKGLQWHALHDPRPRGQPCALQRRDGRWIICAAIEADGEFLRLDYVRAAMASCSSSSMGPRAGGREFNPHRQHQRVSGTKWLKLFRPRNALGRPAKQDRRDAALPRQPSHPPRCIK